MDIGKFKKYFANKIDHIREQLRFKNSVLDSVKYFIDTNVSDSTSQLVGVHVRRGDYIGERPISSDEFILNAMVYFKRRYGPTNFIFVSDDKPYCREVFGNRDDSYFSPDSFSPGEDMALLTLCHHVIITVGTFGWWGAYLLQNRDGEVLVDSKPNHDPLDVNCSASTFYPPWYKFMDTIK